MSITARSTAKAGDSGQRRAAVDAGGDGEAEASVRQAVRDDHSGELVVPD